MNMKKNALIIFVRNPVLGKVKTRIAEKAGAEKALAVYENLLRHTCTISAAVHADKYVFYSDFIEPDDLWSTDIFYKHLQQGNILGEKMQTAFEKIAELGYGKVCIIGSDCYELTTAIIDNAFTALEKNDLVIGPAYDGGYYLLGMKKIITPVFNNKEWSTPSVYPQTIIDLQQAGMSYAVLPLLNDIDEWEDVPEHFFR